MVGWLGWVGGGCVWPMAQRRQLNEIRFNVALNEGQQNFLTGLVGIEQKLN